MASLPPGSERYHQALQAARARSFELTEEHVEELVALLERWVEMVEGRIENQPDLMHNRIQMRDFTHDMIDRLVEQMAETTREQVVLTTEEMAEFHTRATVEILEEAGQTGIPVAFDAMSFQAAQSVLARPELSAAMVSVREEATAVADEIIQESVAVGRDTRQFARRLRPTILGADELSDRLLDDFGQVNEQALVEMGLEPTQENLERLRDQVGFIQRRSQLIARTETMNAEQEAGARFEANSPVVDLVDWFLSQRHPRKDVCDVLAGETDWDPHGHGPGLYDPRAVPARPHPRCLCGRRIVLRDPEDFGAERGDIPEMQPDTEMLVTGEGLPPSQVRMMERALETGRTRARSIGTDVGTGGLPGGPRAGAGPDLEDTVQSVEEDLVGRELEQAVVFDEDGAEVLRASGEVDRISFTDEELDRLSDTVFTHNHPDGGSLSGHDAGIAIKYDLREMRAVDENYRYRLTRPEDGWMDPATFEEAANRARQQVFEELEQQIELGNATPGGAGGAFSHLVNRRLREELGEEVFPYMRELLDG